MKKRYVVIMAIAILVLIVVAGIGIYHIIKEQGKDYQVENIREYNYFVLRKEGKYGVMDRTGNIVVEPEYTEVKIPNPEKAVFVCYQGENTKVVNERKEVIFAEYDKIQPIRLEKISSDLMYEKSTLKYQKDGKYGILNLEGKEITKAIYDEITSLPYKEGELIVKQNDKYGVINIKGNSIIEVAYDEVKVDGYYTDENSYRYAGYIVLIKMQEGYRYGYLNYKGKEILKTEYNEISRVTEIEEKDKEYLICAKNGQYGIARQQEVIVGNEYQSIQYDATNRVFIVEKSKKYGVVNLEGKLIVPVQYKQIDITGIYLYAQNEQGTTVYNNNGTETKVDANIAILNTSNDKYRIRINNENGTKYGVINREGKQLIEEKYSYIEYLYDNYFIISNENRKLGIIDDKENIKVEPNHDSLQKIKDTDLIQAILPDNKTIQIYTRTMEKVCEMTNAIIEVEENYIKIYNESETKYLDKEGKELKNTEVYANNKIFVAVKDNQYGFVDKEGKVVVNYQYDKAYEFNQYGFASVRKDNKWGVINEQGQEIVAPIYEIENQKQPFFIGRYYRVIYGLGEFYFTDENK